MPRGQKVRKIPVRICVGCQEARPKKELIRIVRTPEGEVVLDPTGKKSGRGAYVCPSLDCLEKAWKGKHLERALKAPIPPELAETLREAVRNLPVPGRSRGG
ncbi:MAG: YlxR family protein [Firmicutes bacterium]|nr:YlxR family protein [Bacillota bacterium]MCL5040155.1 YlxR family protein [Bacillota bacterium]